MTASRAGATSGANDTEFSYVESRSPGHGRLRPRAYPASDTPCLELDGEWRFRLAADLNETARGFERPEFDDSALGRARRAVDVAALRLRHARLHQRRLPVPDRPAARARRQPDRRVPARLRSAGDDFPRGRAVLRFDGRRLVLRGLAQRDPARRRQGQPAADRVRRSRPCCGRGTQRAGRTRPPVVGGQLPRGPGHVVAVRDLPLGRGSLGPRASRTTSSTPTTTTPPERARCASRHRPPATLTVPELGLVRRRPGRAAHARPGGALVATSSRGSTTGELVGAGGERDPAAGSASGPGRGRRRRDLGQRHAGPVPRRQPARVAPRYRPDPHAARRCSPTCC